MADHISEQNTPKLLWVLRRVVGLLQPTGRSLYGRWYPWHEIVHGHALSISLWSMSTSLYIATLKYTRPWSTRLISWCGFTWYNYGLSSDLTVYAFIYLFLKFHLFIFFPWFGRYSTLNFMILKENNIISLWKYNELNWKTTFNQIRFKRYSKWLIFSHNITEHTVLQLSKSVTIIQLPCADVSPNLWKDKLFAQSIMPWFSRKVDGQSTVWAVHRV